MTGTIIFIFQKIISKKLIEVEILLCNCNFIILKTSLSVILTSVNFNLQYYSNVVPTNSHAYFTAFFTPK